MLTEGLVIVVLENSQVFKRVHIPPAGDVNIVHEHSALTRLRIYFKKVQLYVDLFALLRNCMSDQKHPTKMLTRGVSAAWAVLH